MQAKVGGGNIMSKEKVIKECEGCLKSNGVVCNIIKEPRYIWEKHENCFARCENLAEMEEMEKAIYNYSHSKAKP